MTQITADMVKELRMRTGTGIMECKKALVESGGDLDKAIEALRKAGQAKAIKKGMRATAEGLVSIALADNNKSAAIVEVNCETDFVAREAGFKQFVLDVAASVLKNKVLEEKFEETRLALISKLGENISVRRVDFQEVSNGVIGTYIHGSDDAARIASLVCIDTDDVSLATDLAMQVAAMDPEYLDESLVPEERIAKEKEIFMVQAKEANANKPEDILSKIVNGKLKKFIKDITLLGQVFVKDSSQNIAQLLQAKKAKILDYKRFEVGEGIAKKTDNFVEEVMAQVKS
jgi:elongation factor Ts